MAYANNDPLTIKFFTDRYIFLMKNSKMSSLDDFVLNTFMQASKVGWKICTNSKVCNSLEKMMEFANSNAIGCILKLLCKNIYQVFDSKFAHHVLHAAIKRCHIPEIRTDPLVQSLLLDYFDHVWDSYPNYLQNIHAGPALRVYLQLMSGVDIPKNKHQNSYDYTAINLYEPLDINYQKRIVDITNKLLLSNQLNDFIVDPLACPFLQVLLIVCSKRLPELMDSICSHILKKSILLNEYHSEPLQLAQECSVKLPLGFTHDVAVYFLEALIGVLPGKRLCKFIRRRLLLMKASNACIGPENSFASLHFASFLAGHPVACRVLRAAITSVRKATNLEEILLALQMPGPATVPGLCHALNHGQHYLLTSLSAACKRHGNKNTQSTFEMMIFQTFGYSLKEKQQNSCLIRSIVSLRRLKDLGSARSDDVVIEGDTTSQNTPQTTPLLLEGTGLMDLKLTGCLLAEDLFNFKFHRPIRVATSLVSLTSSELFAWSRHYMLHHVIENAILSESVPVERKRQLVDNLKARLGSLALDRHGSRIVEAIWEAALTFPDVVAVREEIVSLLSPLSQRLALHRFGRCVEASVATRAYLENAQRWRKAKLPAASKVKGENMKAAVKRLHSEGKRKFKRPKF